MISKVKYLFWSFSRIEGADKTCPGCRTRERVLRRAYLRSIAMRESEEAVF